MPWKVNITGQLKHQQVRIKIYGFLNKTIRIHIDRSSKNTCRNHTGLVKNKDEAGTR